MLPKRNRLSREDIEVLCKSGEHTHSPFFVVRSDMGHKNKAFSMSVPKKAAPSAVDRNRLRRRGYNLLTSMWSSLQGGRAFITAKKQATELTKEAFDTELKKALKKAGLLE